MNSVEQLRETWGKVLAMPPSEIEDDDSFFDCTFLLPRLGIVFANLI